MAVYQNRPIQVQATPLVVATDITGMFGAQHGDPGDYLITDPSGQYIMLAADFDAQYLAATGTALNLSAADWTRINKLVQHAAAQLLASGRLNAPMTATIIRFRAALGS